ncbi:MAG: FixH family protein [Pseudomonadota bacterium]|nr:MAG: FixH family protein [Pseudomonadota bacterium]
MTPDAPKTPWYRIPMVWLLIVPPVAAVIGGVATLTLAIRSNDGLVVDDYYRRGKEINRVLDRDRAAASHGLRGEASFDGERRVVRLTLEARAGFTPPAQLTLELWHATRAGLDRELQLTRQVDGVYAAPLWEALPAGRWNLQLSADDWRLIGSVSVPGAQRVALHATGAS